MRQTSLHGPGTGEDLERRFSKAAGLYRSREAKGAEGELRRILDKWPDHAPSLNLLALIVGRDGRDAECVALLERAIAHGSAEQAAASALLLGAAHERSNRIHAAEAAYKRALASAPERAEGHLKLGLFLLRHGRPERASGALRDALATDPDLALAHSALASALQALGDLAGAAESAARAVALGPDDPVFLSNLAIIRNLQGRFTDELGRGHLSKLTSIVEHLCPGRAEPSGEGKVFPCDRADIASADPFERGAPRNDP